MIHSLNLWPQSREVFGSYDAQVIPALAGLDHNQCYKPKLYTAPSLAVQLMAPGDYLRYQMQKLDFKRVDSAITGAHAVDLQCVFRGRKVYRG